MRDKDLLVAVGKDVRMTSLGGGEGWDVKDGVVGSYKVGGTESYRDCLRRHRFSSQLISTSRSTNCSSIPQEGCWR